jgi:hypothetical protein
MSVVKSKVPDWAFADGSPKPEYRLDLKITLSDGTKSLMLTEPNIKTLRRATKLLQYGPADAKGDREETGESGLAFGIALISGVTNLPDDVVEELPQTAYKTAIEYLLSFR